MPKDFELEVKFKLVAQPVFKKPQLIPFALQDDLYQAYDAGIAKGVWSQYSSMHMVLLLFPFESLATQISSRRKYVSVEIILVTANPQLEPHQNPLPIPEDLIRKLGGGYGFTKVDLADAFNQTKLGPESRKRLVLSTHRGVLL